MPPPPLTQLQAALWVVAAVLVFVYGKVGAAAGDSSGGKSLPWALGVGYASVGVFLTLGLYLVVYLPYIARIHLPWSTYVPWAVPAGAAAGVTAYLAFTVGLWPSYGLAAPAVVGVLAIGAIMAAHFLPSP